MREGADLGAAVHRGPPPIGTVRIGLSGVQGDADLNADAALPLPPRQGALNVQRARHGVTRAREQREGGITHAAVPQRRSPAGHHSRVDQLLVAPQTAGRVRAMPREKPRGVLDLGHHHRHGAARERADRHGGGLGQERETRLGGGVVGAECSRADGALEMRAELGQRVDDLTQGLMNRAPHVLAGPLGLRRDGAITPAQAD